MGIVFPYKNWNFAKKCTCIFPHLGLARVTRSSWVCFILEEPKTRNLVKIYWEIKWRLVVRKHVWFVHNMLRDFTYVFYRLFKYSSLCCFVKLWCNLRIWTQSLLAPSCGATRLMSETHTPESCPKPRSIPVHLHRSPTFISYADDRKCSYQTAPRTNIIQ